MTSSPVGQYHLQQRNVGIQEANVASPACISISRTDEGSTWVAKSFFYPPTCLNTAEFNLVGSGPSPHVMASILNLSAVHDFVSTFKLNVAHSNLTEPTKGQPKSPEIVTRLTSSSSCVCWYFVPLNKFGRHMHQIQPFLPYCHCISPRVRHIAITLQIVAETFTSELPCPPSTHPRGRALS
ncbi:hypothetical protein BD779DRAFT_309716 [Infundibulicybe gibba]|nr:hypothetical protein BD779DRAFT_309716 [Infundibulicybe gibba]